MMAMKAGMKPWWSLRGPERKAAKAEYEATHSVPRGYAPIDTGTTFVGSAGIHWPHDGTHVSRTVAKMGALAGIHPNPRLVPAADSHGIILLIGESGHRYVLFIDTPVMFAATYRAASATENVLIRRFDAETCHDAQGNQEKGQ